MTEAGSAERRIYELAAQHGIAVERLPLEDWGPISPPILFWRGLRLTSQIFSSMVLNGGKGTSVSGRRLGSIVSGWLLGNRVRDVKGLTMAQNGKLKRRVRACAAKTGESYTAALQHIRQPPALPSTGERR